jgi:hypothetical protein
VGFEQVDRPGQRRRIERVEQITCGLGEPITRQAATRSPGRTSFCREGLPAPLLAGERKPELMSSTQFKSLYFVTARRVSRRRSRSPDNSLTFGPV